jgi:hypothetical protein
MVHLVQTMDLSCTETNTISKSTETRFYMTHVTSEFHRVSPKRFPSLRNIRRKPCNYLESRLALYPKGPKPRSSIECVQNDSTWPTSPRSSIECVQNDSWGCGTFGANCRSILHREKYYLQMDRNEILHDPHHLGVPSGASKIISKLTVRSAQTVQLSWLKISTISKRTETSFHLSLSPRSTIRCIQNDFWGYGIFGANRAPILHWN